MQRIRLKLSAYGAVRLLSLPSSKCGGPNAAHKLDKRCKLQEDLLVLREAYFDHIHSTNSGYPVGFGSLGRATSFTRRGAETLREYGSVADAEFGGRQLLLTWTIPGGGAEVFRAVAEWSAYITERVMQWIRDHCASPMVAWVFEFQKRGALHQHLLVGSEDFNGLHNILVFWDEFISNLFEQVSRRSQVDLFRNDETGSDNRNCAGFGQDADWVRKSAARYLSKYMGKIKDVGQKCSLFTPSRWWRVNNTALEAIKARRNQADFDCATTLEFKAVVQVIREHLALDSSSVFEYANAQFPWMLNYVTLHESFEIARRRWEIFVCGLKAFEALDSRKCSRRWESYQGAAAAQEPASAARAAPSVVSRLFSGRLIEPQPQNTATENKY